MDRRMSMRRHAAVVLLVLLAAAQPANVHGTGCENTTAQTQKLRLRTGRRTYHVVGMVPYGNIDYKDPNHLFNRKHRPALAQYLTQVVGTKFDPPVNFTIRVEDAYNMAPFDDPIANERDFTFTYPNMAGCLEAEFLQVPLTTVRNYRGGKELNHYGGVVYALKERTDIRDITDLKDKVVTASNFKLCQHQWRVFDDAGVSLMAETAQVRFTSKGEDSIPFDVLSGITDAAFTRTDYLESFLAKDPVNGARLRILNPVTPPPILDGEPFPFQTTSELYPEYGLLAGKHVEWELQREVLTALLKLNKNDTVCDDMYLGVDPVTGMKGNAQVIVPGARGDRCKVGYFNESITNITLNEERQNITNEGRCVRILCIAEIAAFQPALSYGPARDLYQTLGLMSLDGAYFSKQKFRFIKKKCN
jgi:hypothetical protein